MGPLLPRVFMPGACVVSTKAFGLIGRLPASGWRVCLDVLAICTASLALGRRVSISLLVKMGSFAEEWNTGIRADAIGNMEASTCAPNVLLDGSVSVTQEACLDASWSLLWIASRSKYWPQPDASIATLDLHSSSTARRGACMQCPIYCIQCRTLRSVNATPADLDRTYRPLHLIG